jgi:hypothetical protein
MSCLTKICFLFRICHLLHRCHHPLIPPLFCLTNLRMLHIRLCYCLTTVQVPDVVLALSSFMNLHRQDLLLLLATSIAAWIMQRARPPRPQLPRRPRGWLTVGRLRLLRRLRGRHRPRRLCGRHRPRRLRGRLRPCHRRPPHQGRLRHHLGQTRQRPPRLRSRCTGARLPHRRLPLPTRQSLTRLQLLWFFVHIRAAGAVFTGLRNALMALLHGSLPAWLKRSLILLRNPDTFKPQ